MALANYTNLDAAGYQAISATSSTAVGLTITAASAASATLPAINFAFFVCETNSVRWRDDGTDPTATTGTPLLAGNSFEYDGEVRQIKFISQSGTGTVHANLYRAF